MLNTGSEENYSRDMYNVSRGFNYKEINKNENKILVDVPGTGTIQR